MPWYHWSPSSGRTIALFRCFLATHFMVKDLLSTFGLTFTSEITKRFYDTVSGCLVDTFQNACEKPNLKKKMRQWPLLMYPAWSLKNHAEGFSQWFDLEQLPLDGDPVGGRRSRRTQKHQERPTNWNDRYRETRRVVSGRNKYYLLRPDTTLLVSL